MMKVLENSIPNSFHLHLNLRVYKLLQSLTSLHLKAQFLLLVSKIAGGGSKNGDCHSADDARHLPAFGRCVSNEDRVKEKNKLMNQTITLRSSPAEHRTSITAMRLYLKSIQSTFTVSSMPFNATAKQPYLTHQVIIMLITMLHRTPVLLI